MFEDVSTLRNGEHSFRHAEIPLIVAKYMSLLYPGNVYYVVWVITHRYRVFSHYDKIPMIHKGITTTFIKGINTGWPLKLPNNLAKEYGQC